MKHPIFYNLSLAAIVLLFVAVQASARPIGFSEISLMIRMHESEASIRDEVAQRKLLHPLTGPQETLLKAQGASDSLVQSLRNSNLVASKEEAAAAEAATAHQSASAPDDAEMSSKHHGPHVTVFDVAMGHPINLSQWGGLDYEIAFYSYRFAGEDHIQPAFIDPVGTRTVVSRLVPLDGISENEFFTSDWFPTNSVRNWRFTPYNGNDGSGGTWRNGRGDFQDTRSLNFNDSVGVSSQFASRPIVIDWDNPVFFNRQPYTFYPVYSSGGVSLYYISSSSDSVKLAVSTRAW